MDENFRLTVRKYALENAIKYKGLANPGAVIGKVLGENPDLKGKAKEIGPEIMKIVNEVNSMPLENQEAEFRKIAPEGFEKKERAEKDIFDFLGIGENEKVVSAFPPEPSKYPHIGHAKAIVVNYGLAKKYNGKFILRFEDTNPELADKEFYKIHLDNYKWLGIIPDKVDIASDYMSKMYGYAKKFVTQGSAYICTCSAETMKEQRKEGIECGCRKKSPEINLAEWKKMQKAEEGSMVLRLKGDMQSDNSTLRDPVIFRIIDKPHARTKKKYKVWPNYDFENGIMDGIEGVTHRLRTKEFELRNELQRIIQKLAGFGETKIYEFARFNLEGVESSGRVIREKVQNMELIGWDDPSLTTLVALRRRGFVPEAVREFVLSTGLTKNEAVLTWDDLIAHNRRALDKSVNRLFFIENPVEIFVENAPSQKVELKLHPEDDKRGARRFKTKGRFYISKKDFDELENGKMYRFMDCLNFRKENGKFAFDSLDYENYKNHGDKIMHWLPVENKLAKIEVLMPTKETKTGLAEPLAKKMKVGEMVQFVRFGFCRLDKKEKEKLIFWFTHD